MEDPEEDPAESLSPEDTVYHRLGELIVTWNQATAMQRHLLWALSGKTHTTDILTAHMGEVSLCDALRTLNNEYQKDPMRRYIDSFVVAMGKMREIRNYYAHGIVHTLTPEYAVLQKISAKSDLRVYMKEIDHTELRNAVLVFRSVMILGKVLWIYHVTPDGKRAELSQFESFLEKLPELDVLHRRLRSEPGDLYRPIASHP